MVTVVMVARPVVVALVAPVLMARPAVAVWLQARRVLTV